METDVLIGTFAGVSVGLGMLISTLTQILKMVDSIPFLSKIPGVQAVVDFLVEGQPAQTRIFIAVVAVIGNVVSVYLNTGEILTPTLIFGTLGSFMTALGTYDIAFKKESKPQQ